MRIRSTILLLLLTAGTVGAQTTISLPSVPYRKEAGIFAANSNSGNTGISLIGLQYQNWVTEYKGFHAIAALGSFHYDGGPVYIGASADTAIRKNTRSDINMAVIGAGIDAQRRFYKRIFLFASMELRAGYGSGYQDTVTERSLFNGTQSYNVLFEAGGRQDVNMFYLGFVPSVGARLQLNRLTFGLQFSGINLSYRNATVKGRSSSGVLDMDAGNVSNRLFICYKL